MTKERKSLLTPVHRLSWFSGWNSPVDGLRLLAVVWSNFQASSHSQPSHRSSHTPPNTRHWPRVHNRVGAKAVVIRMPQRLAVITLVFVVTWSAGLAYCAPSAKALAPFGSTIDADELDGVLGFEWVDAQSYDLAMGRFAAQVFLKRDADMLYIAIVVDTGRQFAGGFEVYVVFQNGDGVLYAAGDDMLLVAADGGTATSCDYGYVAPYDFRRDDEIGGTCDALGVGVFDPQLKRYVFEFARTLESVDIRDVSLAPGDEVRTVYGWASY